MKKFLIATCAMAVALMLAGPAAAWYEKPDGGHVLYMYAEGPGAGEWGTCEFFGTGAMSISIYLVPGPEGAHGGEWKMTQPEGNTIFVATTTKNPEVGDALIGGWLGAPGISFGILRCVFEGEWFWVVTLDLFAMTDIPGYFTIVGHDDTDEIVVPICEGARPLELVTVYNYFGFQNSCMVSTQESSWGAIKSMMK